MENHDFTASISNYYDQVKARLRSNRDLVLSALQQIQATHVIVNYSGSGDSGAIDSVEVRRGDTILETEARVSVLMASSYFDPQKPGWTETLERKTIPIKEALEELVYDWLQVEHGGWENNEGASGEVTIDVEAQKFLLEHTSYYTESDYSESTL